MCEQLFPLFNYFRIRLEGLLCEIKQELITWLDSRTLRPVNATYPAFLPYRMHAYCISAAAAYALTRCLSDFYHWTICDSLQSDQQVLGRKYNLSTKHKKSKNVAVNFNPLSILNTDVTDNRQNCDANSRT